MPCDNSLADGRGATLRAFAGTLVRGDRARVAAYVLVSLLAAFAGSLAALLLVPLRSEEHTSELQSLMRISYAVFCLKKKKIKIQNILWSNSNSTGRSTITQSLYLIIRITHKTSIK